MRNVGPSDKKSLMQLHPRRIDIVLLIFASAASLYTGFQLPVLTVKKLWEKNTFSILSGIHNLWMGKHHFLAGLIFFFSVIFPVVKLLFLALIWFMKLRDEQRRQLLFYLETLGRWSMLDVFVAAVLVVTVKLGALATARLEDGIYFFGMAIFLAMLVTTLQSQLVRRF